MNAGPGLLQYYSINYTQERPDESIDWTVAGKKKKWSSWWRLLCHDGGWFSSIPTSFKII
ncbi:MAG: hypothetical protein IPO25_18915 [Saprospiraceae bacterium]|nr:hypothetical protein [Saprospiraceae bacterium]